MGDSLHLTYHSCASPSVYDGEDVMALVKDLLDNPTTLALLITISTIFLVLVLVRFRCITIKIGKLLVRISR